MIKLRLHLIAAMSGPFRYMVRDPIRNLASPPPSVIPALDVLRTCAVLLVILGHNAEAYVTQSGHTNKFSELPFVRNGWIGVDLFFVLSGLLIGNQIWKELQATNRIDVGQFVLRRGFRIWPLYFFVFAFSVLVMARGEFPFGRGWTDMVFLTNYINYGIVGGSWSLCTEEQFYLIAPLLIALSMPQITSIRSYQKFLIGLLVALPIIRAGTWWGITGSLVTHDPELFLNKVYQPIHTHADGLILGLLLSNILATRKRGEDTVWVASSFWTMPLAFAIGFLFWAIQREILGFTAVTLIFGSVCWYLLDQPCRSRHPLFRSKIFYLISRLSFGMYLWHPFVNKAIVRHGLKLLPLADRFPAIHNAVLGVVLILVSVFIAVITFCLVEHPFLQLREIALARQKIQSSDHSRA